MNWRKKLMDELERCIETDATMKGAMGMVGFDVDQKIMELEAKTDKRILITIKNETKISLLKNLLEV